MAEIIGLTASLITLAGVGAKLATTLLDATDALNSAHHEARLIAADISIFASSLVQLSKTLPMVANYDIPEAEKLLEITEVLVLACTSLVEELQRYIGEPVGVRMRGGVWVRALGWHFRWFFARGKVGFVRGLMGSFKSTLVFLVATMDLAVVMKRDGQFEVRESMKLQVESNLRFAEDAKTNLLKCQEPKEEPALLTLTNGRKSIDVSNGSSIQSVPALELPAHSIVPYDEMGFAAGQSLDVSQLDHEDDMLQVACLDDCPTELVRILSVQEATLEVAETLLKTSPVPTFSWGPPGASQSSRNTLRDKVSLGHEPSSERSSGATPGRPESEIPTSSAPIPLASSVAQSSDRHEPAVGLDPLQFLDAGQIPAGPDSGKSSDDQLDIQRMIRRIIEETLSAQMHDSSTTPIAKTETEPLLGLVEPVAQPVVSSGRASTKAPPSTSGSNQRKTPISRDTSPPPADEDGNERFTRLERALLAEKDERIRQNALNTERDVTARLLEAANTARTEAEKKAKEDAEASKKAHEKALAEIKMAQEETERARIVAEYEAKQLKPSDKPKLPIRFKDAVGREFSFPWHLVETWKGMEKLINQAFLHVEKIGPEVLEGRYDLTGPDGEIILPQLWETIVQPNMAITMHMWPVPEQPAGEKKSAKSEATVKNSRFKSFGKLFVER